MAALLQNASASPGLILSLSKDEAAAPPVDASSFDRLRMRRMQAVLAASSGASASQGD